MRQTLEPKADVDIATARHRAGKSDSTSMGEAKRIQRAVVVGETSPTFSTVREAVCIGVGVSCGIAKGSPWTGVERSSHTATGIATGISRRHDLDVFHHHRQIALSYIHQQRTVRIGGVLCCKSDRISGFGRAVNHHSFGVKGGIHIRVGSLLKPKS